MKVRKAIIPCGGLGTRFLPCTKALAKEMLPIIDIPTVQYQVEEAVNSGIEEVILIISPHKGRIKKHFDRDLHYEDYLIKKGKFKEAEQLKQISTMANITYVYQDVPNGLGGALLCAKEALNGEPFALLLGDDLVVNFNGEPVTKQMMDIYEKTETSMIGCQNVAESEVSKYGIMKLKAPMENRIGYLEKMIEKPKREEAPSRLACLGRYLLSYSIIEELEKTPISSNGEIMLTDAFDTILSKEDIIIYDFIGRRYDVGDKYGYVEAIIDFSLRRDDLKDKVVKHIKELDLK